MSHSPQQPVRILMACMGNICRSPTAEGVFRHRLLRAGLLGHVDVDSAGTHAYHVGSPPDARSQEHAATRGYDLSELRARQVQRTDFEQFDLLLAMDWDNLALLEDAAPPGPHVRCKLRRLTEFIAPDSPHSGAQVVPDPYYGGPQGFDHVLDLVEAASDGLLAHVQQVLRVQRPG